MKLAALGIAVFAIASAWAPTAAVAVDCNAYCVKRCANNRGSMISFCQSQCVPACLQEAASKSKRKKK